MWSPLPPAPPERGWWTELPTEFDHWVEGVRDGLRAERIERCRQLAHETDMTAGFALARDRRTRAERRYERRGVSLNEEHHPGGVGVGEVEHYPGGGILGVR